VKVRTPQSDHWLHGESGCLTQFAGRLAGVMIVAAAIYSLRGLGWIACVVWPLALGAFLFVLFRFGPFSPAPTGGYGAAWSAASGGVRGFVPCAGMTFAPAGTSAPSVERRSRRETLPATSFPITGGTWDDEKQLA
jgi:hypothetical protein